jgi:Uma2 family endonuclease
VEPASADLKGQSTEVPAIVVEVLSPATEEMDFNVKLSEYRRIASLQAYIVASQDEARCWFWLRFADGAMPELPSEIAGPDGVIDIPTLALSIPLEEIYRGIVRNG